VTSLLSEAEVLFPFLYLKKTVYMAGRTNMAAVMLARSMIITMRMNSLMAGILMRNIAESPMTMVKVASTKDMPEVSTA